MSIELGKVAVGTPTKTCQSFCPVTMQDLFRTQGVRLIFVRTFSDVGHKLRKIRVSAYVMAHQRRPGRHNRGAPS